MVELCFTRSQVRGENTILLPAMADYAVYWHRVVGVLALSLLLLQLKNILIGVS